MEVSVRAELRHQAYQANLRASQNKPEMNQDFRNIYTDLTNGLATEESKLAAKPPPPELMILVVRNMIYPDILSAYIPDLLEVLSNIEKWRGRAHGRAGRALACDMYWPQYFKPYPSGLTDSDRNVLQYIFDAHEVTRTKYIEILEQYCHSHLCYIWTAQFPVNEKHFTQVFQSYFSPDKSKLCLALQDLTSDEVSRFTEVKKEWAEFVARCATDGYSAEPNVEIPNRERLVVRTEAYLVLVQKEVDTLERIFNDDAYKYRVGGVLKPC
ncbi:hypothetical protein J3R30DRAFT_1807562 [Lentinula aciculospora]|uniref:Uncharacterized protein n=1 Tax=Lentinula aciculospora TaxID=153920 RepID=A0A9W9AKI4_9AGAR|nr:hypothetical protein J3R30DRAFT_1807562 [Lentinula aciculospora]